MLYRKAIVLAGLAIALGLAEVGTIGFPEVAIAQSVKERNKESNALRASEAERLLQQGIKQYRTNQHEAALQSLQQALALYRAIQDRNGEAYVLMNLGNAYQTLSQYEKAIAYYEQARSIFQQIKDRNGEAKVLDNLGNAYSSLSQYDKAIAYYEQARQSHQKLKNRDRVTDVLIALGNVYEALAQYGKAIDYHEQSLAIARKDENQLNEGRSLGNLGTVYVSLGDYEKAIRYHEQSLAIKRKTKDRLGEGRVLSAQGNAYLALGDAEKAIALHTESLRIAWDIGDRYGEASALRSLGEAYEARGRYDKAIEAHKQSLAIAQEIVDRRGEAKSLINLGVAYRGRGKYTEAIEYHESSLVITRKIGDRRAEGSALGNLGMDYYAQGNYPKAIEYHEKRLVIAREIKDRQGEGNGMGNLGNAYRSQGNYAKAIEYHEKRLAITLETKEIRGQGQSLGYLGLVYRTLGDYDKSIEYYKKSLAIARKINDRLTEAKSLGYLGNAYYDAGYYSQAIEHHQLSLEVARTINDRRGQGKSLGYLGNAYEAQGKYDEAIKHYQSSLEIAREVNDRRGEGETLSSLGGFYYSRGDHAKAIDYHKAELDIARKIKNRDGERIALSKIGSTLQKQSQPDLAIVFYKQSVNVSESMRKEMKKLPREVQEIYTSSVAGTYRSLADLLLTQERIREAQSILELLKVQEVQSYGDGETTSPIQLRFHASETKALEGFEAMIATDTVSLQTLTALAQPLSQNRDRIVQDSNNIPSEIGNPQAVLQANPNSLLIQNLVVGDKLWVIWTTASEKTTAIAVPNVTQARLNITVEKFRQQIGSPYSDLAQLKATSQQLYNWLIPPQLQAELNQNPQQHLIFSLDHVTRYIPVAVLFDGNQYLAQRYILSNLITTASDTRDRLSLNGQPPNILALGTSKAFPPTFNALPNVPAELSAIVRDGNKQGIYPGKIRLNEAFTTDSLRDNRDSFRVLHIATHGSFNPKSITESFLLLGDGNRLPITEIASLTNLNTTHLVVLSACETGLSGSAQDGTEISGISGYFLYRGAKAVIASLWSVNDASTTLLMQQFYKNLAQGISKSEALRQAQLFLLNQKTSSTAKDDRAALQPLDPNQQTRPELKSIGYSHPYYWAPFILIGNGL